MLDVHPPHEALHTWKAFLIQIVAIVIGLLIAVGLEQTVEFFHHRHQRLQLEEQMHEIFEDNAQVIATDIKVLTTLHAYLADLSTAIAARRRTLPTSTLLESASITPSARACVASSTSPHSRRPS